MNVVVLKKTVNHHKFYQTVCLLAVWFGLMLLPAMGWAGWTIPLELRDHKDKTAKNYPLTVLMADSFLKVDTSVMMSEGEKAELIYRGSENRIYYVLHHLQTCIVIDEQSIAGVSANLNQVTRFLDQQLGTQLSRTSADNNRIQSHTGSKTIRHMACQKRSVWQNTTKIQEIWYTSWNGAGLKLADLGPLQQLLLMTDRIRKNIAPVIPLGEWAKLSIKHILTPDGYPVLVQQFNGPVVQLEAILGKPKSNTLTPKDFGIPADYRKTDLISFLLENGIGN